MSKQHGLTAYADGSCLGNPGPGGWGVVLESIDGSRLEFSGSAASTTNNRMEITAAIEALRRLPRGSEVTIRSDSQYLVKTMTLGWKRRENLDLWKMLDIEVALRKVRWEWVRGHSGDALNERADQLARDAALGKPQDPRLDPSTLPTLNDVTDTRQSPVEPGSQERARAAGGPTLSDQDTAVIEDESEIARQLRPLLNSDETLRRCAGCHRAFVTTGQPARMQAYCSLAGCQLKRRQNRLS